LGYAAIVYYFWYPEATANTEMVNAFVILGMFFPELLKPFGYVSLIIEKEVKPREKKKHVVPKKN